MNIFNKQEITTGELLHILMESVLFETEGENQKH